MAYKAAKMEMGRAPAQNNTEQMDKKIDGWRSRNKLRDQDSETRNKLTQRWRNKIMKLIGMRT